MNKMKKVLAILCATSMLVSSISLTTWAAGANLDSSEAGGGTIVEIDNSVKPNITNVVVPTIDSTTYDFTIDPENLLHEFSNTAYADGKVVYFNPSTKTPASISINTIDGATTKWVLAGKVEDVSLTDLNALLVRTAGSEIALDEVDDEALSKFYVWIPDGEAGAGTYVSLTKANISNYVTLTLDASSKITAIAAKDDPLVMTENDTVFDGKIYKDGYTDVDDSDVVDYYDGVDFDANLMIEKTITEGSVISYVDPVKGTNVTVIEAVKQSTNTTEALTIENKSTFDVVVATTVTLSNANGFAVEGASFADADKASLSLAITDGVGAKQAYVDGTTKKAVGYYVLTGTGNDSYTYQTTSKDANTGGHVYKQYMKPNAVGSKVDIKLEATATSSADAITAWKEYAKTLDVSTNPKPAIAVVYSFTKVEASAEDVKIYVDADQNKYTTTESSKWATFEAGVEKYAVTVNGGTSDLATAAADATVTITPTSDEATAIKVTKTTGGDDVTSSVNASEKVEGKFTFKMPAYPVTVEVLNTVPASVQETATGNTSEALTITYSLGTQATAITEIVVGAYNYTGKPTQFNITDSTITISSGLMGKSPSEIVVTFDDGTTDTCTITY